MYKNLRELNIQILAMALVFLVGCVAGEGGKKKASCLPGQTYNTLTRSCSGAQASFNTRPTATTESVSLLEDAGQSTVFLSYTDIDNDFATSCSVTSPSSPGYVKFRTIQGLYLESESDIEDPHNTVITMTSGGVLSVTTSTVIPTIRQINIQLGPGSTALNVAGAINGNATAASWVDAFPLNTDAMTVESSPLTLDTVVCNCFGGVCSTQITPVDNFNGTTDFTYTVTDKDGTSATKTVKLNITSVNDGPTLTLGLGITATELLDTASAFTYSSSGNLVAGTHVSVSDVEDVLLTSFTFQLVTPPAHGTFTLDTLGNYTYRTFEHVTSDEVEVRVFDSSGEPSDPVTIPITVVPINDPPVGTLTSITAFDEEGSAGTVTLTYTDEEGDSLDRCVITSASKVYADGGCSCGATTCTAVIKGLPNQNGTASFGYKIYDTVSPNPPQETTVSFTINAVNDNPIVFPTVDTTLSIQGTESDTFEPTPITFTLDGATDGDSHTILSYSLTTAPINGTISGCLGQGASGLNCTYTPLDGNIADSTTLDATVPSIHMAQVATDTGTFYASTLGDSYNGVEIELVNIRSTDESINTLYGSNAKAYTDGDKVLILFQASLTTGADISAAIDANPDVAKLIDFDVGFGVQTSTGTLTLAGATTTMDKFTFQALDSSGATNTRTVHVSLIPTNDRPTICEYSTYADTTICGLNGCIANTLPTSITPDVDGLVFYSTLSGACYKSSGGSWTPVESSINDRSINELDPIVIDNIKVDEGGGASEDSESLTITNIDSSDENLIPLGNIEVYFDNLSTAIGTGATTPFSLTGSAGASADLKNMRLIITPQTINPPVDEKVSDIEITVQDSSGKLTEVTFTVTVQKVSATHGGWANFTATGPKVDALGLVNESRTVCPYSLDMCETGQKCSGTSSPINNTAADPDHEDAIFMQETGSAITCYRMKRTKIQNLSFVGKTSSTVSISYVEGSGVAADTASVSVSGNAITITMYDDVTTTDTIISAIEGDATANAMVKVINLKAGETQDNQTATNIAPLSNTSWESFETYCSVTPAALEPGCDDGSRKSCIGRGTPVGSVTPTKLDSRFWDEQSNVCYRSVGLTSADWETYDAPAEVGITWNQFSVNGNSSVSEYRVYRRLANEEFDFSKPINRSSITGSSSTFTYTDNSTKSVIPPSPGTTYYYVVRPVVNGVLTSTAAETGTNAIGVARILAPPKNMAFAHRWMINKRICSMMNLTSDTTSNFRCAYKGPGDITASGSQFYDFGKDLLIDRFEAGCPYSPAPACPGTFDNSCIGVSDPTGVITPTSANLMYYSRSEGKCYISTGTLAANWQEFDSSGFTNYFNVVEPNTGNHTSNPQFDSNTDKKYHRASLPPLTNINQADANAFCRGLDDIQSNEMLGIGSSLSHKLPTRKDQIAYSVWDDSNLTDSQIATTETGLSLNSSSKCNSSGASGLTDGYVDFDKPDSNDFYSLPGTASSSIRSIVTGSNETASCTSAFGVQDAVGNVAEWTSHGFNCPLLSGCHGNENLVIQGIEFTKVRPAADGLAIGVLIVNGDGGVASVGVSVSGSQRTIIIDVADFTNNADNVAAEVNADGTASSLVTARVVGDGTATVFPVGNIAFMGFEVTGVDDTLFLSSDTSDDYGYWTLDGLRGPCVDSDADNICDGNITFWAIEDERFSAGRFLLPLGLPAEVSSNSTFNTDYTLIEIGPTSGITSLKLHDDTVNFNSRTIASEATGCGGLSTGGSYLSGNGSGVWNLEAHPCTDTAIGIVTIQDVTIKADDVSDLSLDIQFVDGTGPGPAVSVSGTTLIIDLAVVGSKTASAVASAITVEGTVDAFVSGDPASLQAAFSNPVDFVDMRTDAVSKRVDLGFRCVIEVDNSVYDE